MNKTNHTDQEVQDNQRQDPIGGLAESARRHLAYERLARQVAASEAAARLVLEALAARPRSTGSETTEPAQDAPE